MSRRSTTNSVVAQTIERHGQADDGEFVTKGALTGKDNWMHGPAMVAGIVKEADHAVRGIGGTDERKLSQVEIEEPSIDLQVMIDDISTLRIDGRNVRVDRHRRRGGRWIGDRIDRKIRRNIRTGWNSRWPIGASERADALNRK